MHGHQYPITINPSIKIFAEKEFGGYLIMYKDKQGSVGLVWLPDVDNPCAKDCPAYDAVDV